MKTNSFRRRSGFTLVELLVALGITAIIVSMLVTISASALDGYSATRNRVKAAREARAAFDQLTADLESLVVRSGQDTDWLWASSDSPPGPASNQSPNASRTVFFTSAVDRYDGAINTNADAGGNVSAVGYQLFYRDPISDSENEDFSTFVLYRQIIDPDETFTDLLGEEDLEQSYQPFVSTESNSQNFLCENVYEFSLSFNVQYKENGELKQDKLLVLASGGGPSVGDFRIRGDGLVLDGDPATQYGDGQVLSAEASITVINDSALEILRFSNLAEDRKNKVIEENSYRFAKTIQLPQF